MRQAARTVTPAVSLDVVKADPDDNKILECAVTAGSDFIVSGDEDLLRLGQYDAIRIMTVRFSRCGERSGGATAREGAFHRANAASSAGLI
jgi:predicted nucleic acid-binding protein